MGDRTKRVGTVSVSKEAARINAEEEARLRQKYLPVTNSIERFKTSRKVEMVENGFNYDEASNPGYIATFAGSSNPFDASESILGLDYLFANDSASVFGRILHNQSKDSKVSSWRPTYTLGDVSKLDPKALAARATSTSDYTAPGIRSDVAKIDDALKADPAVKEGPNADFSQYVVYALRRIAATPQYQALSPKLRENYLQHSAKLIVLQLHEILINPLTEASFKAGKTQLGSANISSVLTPVKEEYIASFTEDKNRQHAIRVWKAQKKVVDAQIAKKDEPAIEAKPTKAAGAKTTSAAKTPATSAKTKPEAPKEAPKMVYALQFPATRPFQACKGTALSEAGKALLETSVLAPWQLTSITSFDRNLAKLKKAKTSGEAAKVATIKLDGATGEGKTHAINLLREAYKDSINIVTIDLNSSDTAIKQVEKAKSSKDKVAVVIFDELYFYDEKFLAAAGKAGTTDSATIEKVKAAYIRDLQAQGVLVCVSGATENPLIYKLAAERIKDKLADAYQKLAKEEDRIFEEKLKELGKSTADITEEDLGVIEIEDSDESKRLKEYIAAQEDKLSRKVTTAERMDRKRKTIQAKLSSADTTYAKSDKLDGFNLIPPSKLKPNKSTLYVLPDVDAKGFSAANCKEVVGDQNCVVITPFFLNAGQPNQVLRYKIWTKKGSDFTAQEVQDEDIGKAFAALGSTLPRVIIYDKTTAVGGDLGGLALGVEDIVLQYKSKGKSWDDAVQNAGRDRTPKEKDTYGNEILTAKFHVISDKTSKDELVLSLTATQLTQDEERMQAYLGGKKSETKDYLEKAQGGLEDFTQKLGTAQSDYDLGAAGRYRKKIEDAKRAEEEKKAAFESGKSQLRGRLAEFETLIAEIETSDAEFPTISANAADLAKFFETHGAFLAKVGVDIEKGIAGLKSKASETKMALDRAVESLAEGNATNKERISFITQARQKIAALKEQIDGVEKEISQLPGEMEFSSLSRDISKNLTQSKDLASSSKKQVEDAKRQKSASERDQESLLGKMGDAAAAKERQRLERERALQEKAAQKALLEAERETTQKLVQSLNEMKTARTLEVVALESAVEAAADSLVSEISATRRTLARLKGLPVVEKDSSTADEIETFKSSVARIRKAVEEAVDKELAADKIAKSNDVKSLLAKKDKVAESTVLLEESLAHIKELQEQLEHFKGTKQTELASLTEEVRSQGLIASAQSQARVAAAEREQARIQREQELQREEAQKGSELQSQREKLIAKYDSQLAILRVLEEPEKGETISTADRLITTVEEKLAVAKKTTEDLAEISRDSALMEVEASTLNLSDLVGRIKESIKEIEEISDGYRDISGHNLRAEKDALIKSLEQQKQAAKTLDLESTNALLSTLKNQAQAFIESIARDESVLDEFVNDGKTQGKADGADTVSEYREKNARYKLEIATARSAAAVKKQDASRTSAKKEAELRAATELQQLNTRVGLLAEEVHSKSEGLLEDLAAIETRADAVELKQELKRVKQGLYKLSRESAGLDVDEEEESLEDPIEKAIAALQEKLETSRARLLKVTEAIQTRREKATTKPLAEINLRALEQQNEIADEISQEVETLKEETKALEAEISSAIIATMDRATEIERQVAAARREGADLKTSEAARLAALRQQEEEAKLAALSKQRETELAKRRADLAQESLNKAYAKIVEKLSRASTALEQIEEFEEEEELDDDLEIPDSTEKVLNGRRRKLLEKHSALSEEALALKAKMDKEKQGFSGAEITDLEGEVDGLLEEIEALSQDVASYEKADDVTEDLAKPATKTRASLSATRAASAPVRRTPPEVVVDDTLRPRTAGDETKRGPLLADKDGLTKALVRAAKIQFGDNKTKVDRAYIAKEGKDKTVESEEFHKVGGMSSVLGSLASAYDKIAKELATVKLGAGDKKYDVLLAKIWDDKKSENSLNSAEKSALLAMSKALSLAGETNPDLTAPKAELSDLRVSFNRTKDTPALKKAASAAIDTIAGLNASAVKEWFEDANKSITSRKQKIVEDKKFDIPSTAPQLEGFSRDKKVTRATSAISMKTGRHDSAGKSLLELSGHKIDTSVTVQ